MLFEHSADATNTPGAFAVSRTGTALTGGFRTDDGGNYDLSAEGIALTNGVWHHVALVYDAVSYGEDRVRLYLDQIRQTPSDVYTNDVLSVFRNEILYIGTRADNTIPFTGELDDIRIVDAALATNQFMKKHSDDAPQIFAYWPFTRGNEKVDATGHGFTLAQRDVEDVGFRDGAAAFNGHSGLYTTTYLDLSPFKAVTIEGFFRTTATNALTILAEISSKFNAHRGAFALSTGLSYKDTMAAAYYNPLGGPTFNYECAPEGAINDGVWHHIAYGIDLAAPDGDDRSQLYLDGIRQIKLANQNSAGVDPFVSDHQLYFGWRGSSGDWNFVGEMDDFRITVAALATNEFLSLSARTVDTATNAVSPPADGGTTAGTQTDDWHRRGQYRDLSASTCTQRLVSDDLGWRQFVEKFAFGHASVRRGAGNEGQERVGLGNATHARRCPVEAAVRDQVVGRHGFFL